MANRNEYLGKEYFIAGSLNEEDENDNEFFNMDRNYNKQFGSIIKALI